MTRSAIRLLSLAALLVSGAAFSQTMGQAPAPGEKPFEVAPINPYTWFGRFGLTNCSWVDMGDGVLLVDAGGTAVDAGNLAAQIKETTGGKPIKWIVLTHLHGDSNTGLTALMPTDATLFVNAKVAGSLPKALKGASGSKPVNVIGVSDRLVLTNGERSVTLAVPKGGAHTDHDLFAVTNAGVAFVGDLVTPARCPMTSDPNCDPKGWLDALVSLESLHPAVLLPTRGNGATTPEVEMGRTRDYLNRLLSLLGEYRRKGFEEARVTSSLSLKKDEAYCPFQLDTYNALAIYRRMSPDGSVTGIAPTDKAKAPAPKAPARPKAKAPAAK